MKFVEKIKDFAQKNIDKILHFLVCYVIVFTFIAFEHLFIGLAIAIVLSFCKEFYDKISYNGWSWADLIADSIGILLGVLVGILL